MTTLRRILVPLVFLTTMLGLTAIPAAAEPAAPAQPQPCTTIRFYNSYLSDRDIEISNHLGQWTRVPVNQNRYSTWRKVRVFSGQDIFLRSSAPGDPGVVLHNMGWYTITRMTCTSTLWWAATSGPNGWFD